MNLKPKEHTSATSRGQSKKNKQMSQSTSAFTPQRHIKGVKSRIGATHVPFAPIDRETGIALTTTLPESRPDVAAFDPPNALTSDCGRHKLEILHRIPRCEGAQEGGRKGGGIHRESGVRLASVNQFIIVSLSMPRAEMNGGISSMKISAPVDFKAV